MKSKDIGTWKNTEKHSVFLGKINPTDAGIDLYDNDQFNPDSERKAID